MRHNAPEIRGFSYPGYIDGAFRRGLNNKTLEDLRAQTSADFVAISFFEFQNYDTSSSIAPNTSGINPVTKSGFARSCSIADIETAIRHARQNGMKIMLKPHVDTYSGQWRALIKPDREGRWFRSYTEMLLKYARLAEKHSVEMLSIGVEYLYATEPQHTQEWRKMIREVRKVYSGKLTYGANWSGQPQLGLHVNEFEQVEFWDDLDYIGVDAYFPLKEMSTNQALPLAIENMQRHNRKLAEMSERFGKKIIFVEAGIQSARGALTQPYEYNHGSRFTAIPDEMTQEYYYRAMIETFGRQKWCAGIFWWHWDATPSPFERTDYTVRNKSTARLVRDWYEGKLLQLQRLKVIE